MFRNTSSLIFFAFAALSACAAKGTNEVPSGPTGDASTPVDAAKPDADPTDGGTACTLGTVDHCGTCTTVCSGKTDDTTLVTCSAATAAGKCDITCRGEYYDVDGVPANGCEALAPGPHGIKEAAISVSLPATFDADGGTTENPLNVTGTIFGDARVHEIAPASRPQGREDWYKVSVIGQGDPTIPTLNASLSISALPTDNTFEVCVSPKDGDTFSMAGCATVKGGPIQSAKVASPTNMDGDGIYYVKIRKVQGTNTVNSYTLQLKH